MDKYITFIKSHEKLIIIALAGFLLYRTGQGIDNAWIRHEDHQATQAHTAVVTDTQTNKDLSTNLEQLRQDAAKQTALLNGEIEQKLSALEKQQKQDSQATQQQILDRWKVLLPLKPGAVQSNQQTDT